MSLGPNLKPSEKKLFLLGIFISTVISIIPPKPAWSNSQKISRESSTVNKVPSLSPFSIWFNVKMINLFKLFNGKQFSFASDVKT